MNRRANSKRGAANCDAPLFGRLTGVGSGDGGAIWQGHPRAALLGFAVAVLAYNVLALLQRCIEQVHQATHPALQVSLYHLALQVRGGYEGVLIALPAEP